MFWYVLKMRSSSSALRFREALQIAHLEFYLPTIQRIIKQGGKEVSVEKPLLFGYVFIYTDELKAVAFAADNDGIALLRVHTANGELGPYMTVPNRQMEILMLAVEHYNEEIPFISPTPEMLAKGDRVRVTGGQFKGAEGILEAKQGKDGGRVIIRIGDILAVPTLEIDPQFIEVIEFAPKGRHLYQKLDSFEPRLQKAVNLTLQRQPVPTKLQGHLLMFVRRFPHLTIPAINARVRYLTRIMLAYAVLQNFEEAEARYLELKRLQSAVRTDNTRALLNDARTTYERIVAIKRK